MSYRYLFKKKTTFKISVHRVVFLPISKLSSPNELPNQLELKHTPTATLQSGKPPPPKRMS